jgi:uncharacterized protein (DUF362 family)
MEIDERRVGIAVLNELSRTSDDEQYDYDSVATLISNALQYAGLGNTDSASPLSDIIKPGMSVMLKPNWVMHYNHSCKGMDCMVTHPVFIEAILQQILKTKPGKIVIADAPIQSCDFDSLVRNEWKAKIESLAYPVEISFIDFRRKITKAGRLKFTTEDTIRSDENYVLFDLGKESLLDQITSSDRNFRVTCYNPDELTKSHNIDSHKYLISKEIFDVDVVINLPKLKCHKKAGITAALKNLVGINGNKDYLPHHRFGGSLQQGDCYEGKCTLKNITEKCYDLANRNINRSSYYLWKICAGLILRAHKILSGDEQIDGSWYGNDTVWRMVLDLNRIALYGNKDGSLSDTPLRNIVSITDGIIAGERNGPLAPEPVKMGVVTCAFSSAFADLVHAALMKFDAGKIPLINNAFGTFKYPLTNFKASDVKLVVNGISSSLEALTDKYGVRFIPPDGWKDYI